MPSEDSARIPAEIAALGSTVRVDDAQVPRVDFKHGNLPPLPLTTVPALGADAAATRLAIRAAGLKADEDTNATTRVVTDGVVNGTTLLTSATAAFVAGDVGARITVVGAGVGGADLSARIASRASATNVTLDTAATASGSGKTVRVKKIGTGVNTQLPAAATSVRLGKTVVLG